MRPKLSRGSASLFIIAQRDEREHRARFPSRYDPPTRARDQPRLGVGSLPFPNQHDRAAGEVEEDGKLLHGQSIQSGTRSAAMIVPAVMRSATTA